jgi:hypothetical protein
MSKYYEVVPIDQKPDKEGWYIVEASGTFREYQYADGEWCAPKMGMADPDNWLRPVEHLPLSTEQADPSVLLEALEKIRDLNHVGKRYSIAYDTTREIARLALTTYKESKPSQSITRVLLEKIQKICIKEYVNEESRERDFKNIYEIVSEALPEPPKQ